MNILLVDHLGSYIDRDIRLTLTEMGHKVSVISCIKEKNEIKDPEKLEKIFDGYLSDGLDLVYTTNFLPLLSKACHKKNIKYVSWQYDTPPNIETTEYMDLPTNTLFFFNKKDSDHYNKLGIERVYHLPLAVNTERLSHFQPDTAKYGADISLVGQLYYTAFPVIREGMSEYYKGWVDGLLEAQSDVISEYFVRDMLTDDVIEGLITGFSDEEKRNPRDIKVRGLSYYIAAQLTQQDRLLLLSVLSKHHDTALYTGEVSDEHKKILKDLKIRGKVRYYDEMPIVFKSTKINLCPVLRENTTAIPLRVVDIMGCGAFLMAGYNSEIREVLREGEEFVMYNTMEEACELADYYLAHEEERLAVSRAGYERMKADFTYKDRLEKIFKKISN